MRGGFLSRRSHTHAPALGCELGGVSLPVVGAALYVVVCWAAVTAWQMPLTSVSAVLVVSAVVLAAIRFRGIAAAIAAHTANSTFAAGALVFAAFYVLAYLMARPPAGRALPASGVDGTHRSAHAGEIRTTGAVVWLARSRGGHIRRAPQPGDHGAAGGHCRRSTVPTR